MNLGKRLAVAFKAADLNPPAVSRLTGIPVATINALLRRDSNRSNYVEQLLGILPAHKINVDWVRTGQGKPEPINPTDAPTPAVKEHAQRAAPAPQIARIAHSNANAALAAAPLRAWEHENELPAGAWVFLPRLALNASEAEEGFTTVFLIEEIQAFKADWIRDDQLPPKGLGWSVATDDSMERVIYQGDSFVTDTSDRTEIVSGKVYTVYYAGRMRVRRLVVMPNGMVSLQPENENYETFEVPRTELSIVGRVVRKAGKGGL